MAKQLSQQYDEELTLGASRDDEDGWCEAVLSARLHECGVNVRHAGRVLSFVVDGCGLRRALVLDCLTVRAFRFSHRRALYLHCTPAARHQVLRA